jgi:autotransporter-associated beta strand protein
MKSKSIDIPTLVSLAATFFTSAATADTYQWNGDAIGNDGDWGTDTNWTGIIPADTNITGAHRLNVNGAATLAYTAAQGTCEFTGDGTSRGLAVGSLSSGTMELTGGTFSTLGTTGQDVIGNGDNATGTLIISGGQFIGSGVGTLMGVGDGVGRESILTLNGDGLATIISLAANSRNVNVNLDGGTLELNYWLNQFIGTSATLRLNSGILKARQSTTNFIPSDAKLETLVQAGGAVIDTNNHDITIHEPLLEDSGSTGGGLTKNGGGLLTLAAPSTVTGDVSITAGGLSVKADASGSWTPASLTHSGNALHFELGTANPSNPPVINVGSLTVNSAIAVNVAGSGFTVGQFPLIQYTTKNITGSLTLSSASLPNGLIATLEDNGSGLIYLNVSGTPAPLQDFPVNDTFTAGTGKWRKGVTGSSGTLTNDASRLRWSEGNGSNMAEVIGRSFDAQTLAVGQTIRLTFDFTWTSSGGDILRAGLFNVTTPIAADNWAGSNAIGAWNGYSTFVRDASATGNIARRESNTAASATVGPTNGATGTFTAITSPANTTNYNINDTATVTYQGTFEVTYVSPTKVDTLLTLKEGGTTRFSVTGTTSTIHNTFNTVVFKTGANGPTTYFDNVVVEIPSAASGFASWITGTFSGGTVPGGQQGPNNDPDNDGIDNLLEFVLNGDPTASDPDSLPTLDASGPNFVFTFNRRDDSLSPETIQTFQYGNNLTGWTDIIVPAGNGTIGAATITVITDGTPADTVQISIPKADPVVGKLFGRLKVNH